MGQNTFNLLIADDSPLIRNRLQRLLSDVQGLSIVGEAQGAQEASHMIRELKPDAVTLDVRMPDGNGFEVLQSIRRWNPDPEVAPVVIMLSNYSHLSYRRKAIDEGANFFFDKSTELDQVHDLLLLLAQR